MPCMRNGGSFFFEPAGPSEDTRLLPRVGDHVRLGLRRLELNEVLRRRAIRPTRRGFVFVLLLLQACWASVGCTHLQLSSRDVVDLESESFAGTQSACIPRFPDQDGWYGGDGAYSVPLPPREDPGVIGKSLWLFGDSFVQPSPERAGRAYPFIHNSIAISRCDSEGQWDLETFWGRRADGRPRAFFAPDPKSEWARRVHEDTGSLPYYWLFDGFMSQGVLFIGLLRVAESEAQGPFNLPFRVLGMDLARIENYHDAPRDWVVEISTLADDPDAIPGSAFVPSRDFIYAFTFLDQGDGRTPRALSRLPVHTLNDWQPDLEEQWETWTVDGSWSPGLAPGEAAILMDDSATEMSVHFDPGLGQWVAVYSRVSRETGIADSGFIWTRSAPSLEGPWSKPMALYSIPEMAGDASAENVFCYAAKAHPQFSEQDRLLVTYVCSLFARRPSEVLEVLQRLQDSPSLYRPRAVSVPLPPELGRSSDRSPRKGRGSCLPSRVGIESGRACLALTSQRNSDPDHPERASQQHELRSGRA